MVSLIHSPKFCSLTDYYSELWLIDLRGRLNYSSDNLSFITTVCSFYCTTVVSVFYYQELYFKNCISHTSRHSFITVYLEWIPWEMSSQVVPAIKKSKDKNCDTIDSETNWCWKRRFRMKIRFSEKNSKFSNQVKLLINFPMTR